MAEDHGPVAVAEHDPGLPVEVEDDPAGPGQPAAAVEGPDTPACDTPPGGDTPGDGPATEQAGLLIYVHGYTPEREEVMSAWNTGEPGSLLHSALLELQAAGWLRPDCGGVPEVVLTRQHAMAASLLIAVSALESARLQSGMSLKGVDQLLGALLERAPIPGADEWDLAGE